MNIQIFGTKKCSDTRKAERWFKERRIRYQMIDMKEKGMSRGEFNSVKQSVGELDSMIDGNCRDRELLTLIEYLSDSDREEKILENQHVIITPIVRNGKKATVGYCPEIWKNWD